MLGMSTGAATLEITLESARKAKTKPGIYYNYTAPRYMPKDLTLYTTDNHSIPLLMFYSQVRKWKQPNCPSTNEWIMKVWTIIQ